MTRKRKMNDMYKDLSVISGIALIFLFVIMVIVSFVGCDSGWTIAGWEVK